MGTVEFTSGNSAINSINELWKGNLKKRKRSSVSSKVETTFLPNPQCAVFLNGRSFGKQHMVENIVVFAVIHPSFTF